MAKPKKSRRSWSAGDKMRIVLAGTESGVEISILCEEDLMCRWWPQTGASGDVHR